MLNNDLVYRQSVIEAVDKNTKEDGSIDEDITVILEEIPTAFDNVCSVDKTDGMAISDHEQYYENCISTIIHRIPGYHRGAARLNRKEIQDTLREYEYDDEDIQNISEDFCYGWDAAKYVIVQMLSDRYLKRGRDC